MILGMSVQAFTLLHVFISIAAIAAGFVVVYGMLNGRANAPWTAAFLILTVLTSLTGFLFPITALTPALATGLISSVVLGVALWARYGRKLAGAWRWIYVVTALTALYLNVLVLIVQAFQKVPQLQPLAPTQSEPAFLVAQSAALVLFLVLGTLALLRFRPGSPARRLRSSGSRARKRKKPPFPAASTKPVRTGPAYLSWVEMLVNLVFSVLPRVLTIAMIATEMPAAMRPYSIAVAPDSFLRNATILDM